MFVIARSQSLTAHRCRTRAALRSRSMPGRNSRPGDAARCRQNLRDAAQTRFLQVLQQRLDDPGDFLALRLAGAVDFRVRVTVRPDEPRPNRPLMIRAIALPLVARVLRAILVALRRQRPQPIRRQQLLRHHIEHRLLLRLVQRRIRQADGEDLVWPHARVAKVALDHVVQIILFTEPKRLDEIARDLVGELAQDHRGMNVPRQFLLHLGQHQQCV